MTHAERTKRFRDKLDASDIPVFVACSYFRKEKKWDVTLLKDPGHQDNGDMIVHKEDEETGVRTDIKVEVKQKFLPFTCAADFPFSTIFVCNSDSYKRYPVDDRPDYYMMMNEDMTHAAVLRGDCPEKWVSSPQQTDMGIEPIYQTSIKNVIGWMKL